MPKKSIRKAASGVLPLVLVVTFYVTGGLFADRLGRLPLVAICAAWRAGRVLYGSCTIGIYSDDAVLCVFTQDSRSWRRSEIEEFLVVQWTYRALCAAVSALAI